MALAERQDVIQALAAQGSHNPLPGGVGVSLQLQLVGTIGGDFESSIRSIRWLVGSSKCSATHTWGQQRVLYREGESERTRSLPAAWTDIVGADPYVVVVAGRSAPVT